MYYRTCPECGSNLDPGEQCDCNEEKEFRKEESKVLRLYDLINDKETIIICYRYPRTAVLRQMDAEKIENERRKRKRQIFVRKIKEAAISAIEIAVSIVAGLAFWHIIYEKLLEIRGYEALGGEVIAAGFITFFTFYVFEWIGDRIWTRR